MGDVELSEEVIDNYFLALQQVAQNKLVATGGDLDQISEHSGESDMSKAVGQMPVNTKEEEELKSMIS